MDEGARVDEFLKERGGVCNKQIKGAGDVEGDCHFSALATDDFDF